MAAFALLGGEYGTFDLRSLRRQVRGEREQIERLRVEIDSLRRLDSLIKYDAVTQERIARESFGMIRDGELLYQVVPADTARLDPVRDQD